MKLKSLLSETGYAASGIEDVEVGGITYDSRAVKPGYIFVALPGKHQDGRAFIDDAVAKGAVAVVTDHNVVIPGVTSITAAEPLRAMAALSAAFYQHPDRGLLLVGITGTNGKTTITYFLESIFGRMRLSTGVVGTVNYRFSGTSVPAPNTTPQSADLYRFFADMVDGKGDVGIMEVSSHALALGRVDGLEFDIAVFTNLTRDHLDFHADMEDYFREKAKLFEGLREGRKKLPKFAIINSDDEWGKKLIGLSKNAAVLTYGIRKKADVRAEQITAGSQGSPVSAASPGRSRRAGIAKLRQDDVRLGTVP
jgi:UDP-N-acetylmuramoyl-L-alanyl-D-glutamate--2,6-diaminopimelate ligase